VFGVSGVGKTTACQDLARRRPEIAYVRASQILGQHLNLDSDGLRKVSTDQMVTNQIILSEALKQFRREHPEQIIVVDAHAVIDNDSSLSQVPAAVIASIEPEGLILLEAEPEAVERRRRLDNRPRPIRTVEEISREIAAERLAVLDYGRLLKVPIFVANVKSGFTLDEYVDAILH